MTAASFVEYASAPALFAISEKIPKAPEPDSERTIIKGRTSDVTWIFVNNGANSCAIISIAPLALNIDIPTIIATR